jgi:hypothetical protein
MRNREMQNVVSESAINMPNNDKTLRAITHCDREDFAPPPPPPRNR